MQPVKRKFKNIRNEHLKSICKDTDFILSLKQPKDLYRELTPSSFISNFKTLKNKKPINAVMKEAKYVKII